MAGYGEGERRAAVRHVVGRRCGSTDRVSISFAPRLAITQRRAVNALRSALRRAPAFSARIPAPWVPGLGRAGRASGQWGQLSPA